MMKVKFFQSIILLLSSLALGFLLVEAIFRIYLFGIDAFSVEKVNSTHPLGLSGLIVPSPFPEIVYELKPNLKTIFKMKPFETNSSGLRDKEYLQAAGGNTFRVAVLGDSLTMGAGVSIDNTFHSLLEERFNSKQHQQKFEFINFGVGGYTLSQYLAVLNYKVKPYKPNLILIGFYPGNDHQILSADKIKGTYRVKEATRPFFSSFVIKELYKLRGSRKIKKSPTKLEKKHLSFLFKQFGAYSKKNNIPVIVVYLSTSTNHPVRPILIKTLSKKNELHFIDISKAFDQKNIRSYAIYPSDFHPNGKANAIFAEQLYQFINSSPNLFKIK